VTLPARWPFDITRMPLFYGWVIWLLSTIGLWMTVPGQTMGMAVFTDYFIIELDLGRTELSTAYLLGTVGSSLCLTRTGRWYDRHGARTVMVISSMALGLCVVFISLTGPIARSLAAWLTFDLSVLSFALITLGYFGVRLTGQGILAGANRNILLVWFERRRGLVSGARGVFMSLGFSLAPLVLAALIDAVQWRNALWTLAACTGIGFAFLSLILARDSPEACGLSPHGFTRMTQAPEAKSIGQAVSFTLAQARRTSTFWLYSLSLATYSLAGTAVTFHVVDIFEAAGRGRGEAFAYFLPLASVAVVINLSASWCSDRSSLKPLLVTMLCAFCLGSWGLTHLSADWGFWVVVCGYGIGSGLWATLSNLVYVRFFGRRHLGEVSASGVSLSVLGSAIGPALFSAGKDLTGSYTEVALLCAIVFAMLLCVALALVPKEPAPHRL